MIKCCLPRRLRYLSPVVGEILRSVFVALKLPLWNKKSSKHMASHSAGVFKGNPYSDSTELGNGTMSVSAIAPEALANMYLE